MPNTPSEAEIQKVLEMIKKSHPEQATRENAIKMIETMRSMANTMIDRIDEDLKSGKVRINENGDVVSVKYPFFKAGILRGAFDNISV